ncbi:MAG: dTMP kinase [Phycisphaerales bacterium]|nr:dTMP kinase [Phycisphaerales bacterium]
MHTIPQGRFIVLDGPEGSGKSTQLRLLVDAIQKQNVPFLSVRDPGSTRIGERIRAILLDPDHAELSMRCEMLLYMAARAQMMSQMILPALNEGKLVLCDRFVSSTLAYQSGGEGLTDDQIRAVADVAIQHRRPDLVLLLDIAPERSFQRLQRAKDRIEQRPLSYHAQVRENYLKQARQDPDHHRVIPADRDIETVHKEILAAIGPIGS